MYNNIDMNKFLLFQRQAVEKYDEYITIAAKGCDITKQQADVLIFLYNNPHYSTARDVVSFRGFSKAYVSKAVELLVKSKQAFITVGERDRRVQHIILTDKGVASAMHIRKSQEQFVISLFANISESEISAFNNVIEIFINNIVKE